ncbi:lysosomal acid glucosylceramidase-like isoform X2 [Epargyreus clarus]|uniref:lysosomal acid glucosylceramidase-like isoform X2 n=1 Tax=Epargyreus clarus TaxID=520877 RepID=UPI003C2CBE76
MKLFLVLLFCVHCTIADKPCAARQIPGRSVVCVCNETYCDEVVRQPPAPGQYVIYTTSESGLRFNKTVGLFQKYRKGSLKCSTCIGLDPMTRFQRVEGFGGAVTDAAAINWKSLPDVLQKYLVKSYASEYGLEYNMLRVPIGGCDFSTHPYAYNELPVNDTRLTNFTLAPEDNIYKIPLIKSLMTAATAPIHVVGTTWSPPPWMKTNNNFSGFSRLRREFYQTYADYHLKFIEKYEAAGVPVWGITTTNEPINGVFNLAKFNTLGWDIENMGEWIVNNLGPTIRNSTYKDVKIFTGDDQRFTLPFWFNVLLREHPKALEYIYGIGVHFYADRITPASILSAVTISHPDKVILATEASEGSYPWQEKVELGSWTRAVSYITDIIEDMNHNVVGWIDWNMCLNTEGGPNWARNFVDSPIIVNATNKEFLKQPMFYAMGHVSKFVPRDSRRIKLTEHKSFLVSSVKSVAFLTPRSTIVLIMYNKGSARNVGIKCGKKQTLVRLEAKSITTMEFLSD